ncbi:MAG TPA: hypothetical protein ENJ80_00195 [Gammaproteobacteria bacterium]|nr:hypothetical protein [Gammaproteobacteria bacterium]
MAMKPEDDRIRELYRQARDEAPPAHLDHAILETARKATARRARAVSPFSGRWQVPAALAAVLVVAVLLVPLLEHEPVDSELQVPAPVVLEEPRPAAAPPPERRIPDKTEEEAPPAAQGLMDKRMPEKLMAPEQAVRQERMLRLIAPLAKPKAVARSKKRAADSRAEKHTDPGGNAAVGNLMSGLRGDTVEPPQQWLETISALLEAGEEARAGEELQAFLVQYPDYRLPPALLELQQRTRH